MGKISEGRTQKEEMRYEPSGNAWRFQSAWSSDLHNIKDKQDCPLSTTHPCDVSESCSKNAEVVQQTFKKDFTSYSRAPLLSSLPFSAHLTSDLTLSHKMKNLCNLSEKFIAKLTPYHPSLFLFGRFST